MKCGYFDSLLNAREKYGDKIVLKDKQAELSYTDLLSGIVSIEKELKKLDIQPGDKIGILSYNSPVWLAFFFAIVKCKCIAVCLNYSFTVPEVNDCIETTDCKYVLYGDCLGLQKDPTFISKIRLEEDKKISFDRFTFEKHTDFTPENITDEEFETPAFIIFTSGSTGKPKGCLLTQSSSLCGAEGFLDAIYEIEGESVCVGVPLFHIFGLSMCVAHLVYGGTLYLPKIFSSELMVSYLNEYTVDSLIGVMTVVIRMLDDEAFSASGYPSVKRIFTGGAPLMPIQCYRVERGFGDAVLLNCYGQSETDAGITITTPRDSVEQRVNTVGKPCCQREVFIMSDGKFCKPYEKGEVVLKDNGTIAKGYYKLPKESQAIDENGILHTGDLGYLDEEGYLHLSGRIKDIIIKGGENIIPTDIEKEVALLDEINNVKVLGAKNDLYGESVEACVTLNKGVSISSNEIKAKLKGKIPSFKMPSHFFIFDQFPLKPNGKLDVCDLSIKMLDRLNLSMIDADIENGIKILSIEFKKQQYMIDAIKGITESVLSSIGIADSKSKNKIVLCVEEMLTEIVNKAYRDSGDATILFTLFRDKLRISFVNASDRLIFDEKDLTNRSISVAIIVNYVDSVNYKKLEKGIVEYDMEFVLPESCHSEEFFI